MDAQTPSWGIEPVPDRLRVLGLFDTTLLWTNLGISLLVLVLPAYFDLSLKDALLATVVGGLIGNSMLAAAALVGADGRMPTRVIKRAPLGRRGSYIATVLNVLQCLGWAIFELIVIATAAGLLSDKLFGFEAVWFWKLLFGGLATLLALMGPIGFVRRFVRKFAIWAVAASVVYLAWWIVDGANLGGLWSQPGTHHGSFWLAVDTVVAVTVSCQTILPRVSQRALIVGVSALATAGALAIDMRSYQRFLLLLGAVFVPLLGVLLADWILRSARYTAADIFEGPRFRPGLILAWAAGFVLYEWLYQPTDLGFWSDWLSDLPTPSYQIGASLPSFALAFVLATIAGSLGSARARARRSRAPLARPR